MSTLCEPDHDEITDIQVPHPGGSGTYYSLIKLESRIADVVASLTGDMDHDNLLMRMHSYLTGYRDALLRKPPAIM